MNSYVDISSYKHAPVRGRGKKTTLFFSTDDDVVIAADVFPNGTLSADDDVCAHRSNTITVCQPPCFVKYNDSSHLFFTNVLDERGEGGCNDVAQILVPTLNV